MKTLGFQFNRQDLPGNSSSQLHFLILSCLLLYTV